MLIKQVINQSRSADLASTAGKPTPTQYFAVIFDISNQNRDVDLELMIRYYAEVFLRFLHLC